MNDNKSWFAGVPFPFSKDYEERLVKVYWEYQAYFAKFRNKSIPLEEGYKYALTKCRQSVVCEALKRQWGLDSTDKVVARLRNDKRNAR